MTAAVSFATVLGMSAALHADEGQFRDKVAPILQQHCLSCHNDSDHKGDFSLETAATAFQDDYVEAGDSASSHLIEVITPVDGKAKMPKNADPLSAAEIAAIREWIDDGAKWPDGFSLTETKIADLNWWSLRPLRRPDLPVSWSARADSSAGDKPQGRTDRKLRLRTPIDAFIQKKLDEKGLTSSPEADRAAIKWLMLGSGRNRIAASMVLPSPSVGRKVQRSRSAPISFSRSRKASKSSRSRVRQ